MQTNRHPYCFLLKQICFTFISEPSTVLRGFLAHIFFNCQQSRFCQFTFFFSLAVSYNVCFWRTFQVYTVGYCRVISYASFLCDRFRHNRNIVSGMPHRCQRWLLRIDFRLLKLEFRQQPAFTFMTYTFHVVFICKW